MRTTTSPASSSSQDMVSKRPSPNLPPAWTRYAFTTWRPSKDHHSAVGDDKRANLGSVAGVIHQRLDDGNKSANYLPLIDLRHPLPDADLPGKPGSKFIDHLLLPASRILQTKASERL